MIFRFFSWDLSLTSSRKNALDALLRLRILRSKTRELLVSQIYLEKCERTRAEEDRSDGRLGPLTPGSASSFMGSSAYAAAECEVVYSGLRIWSVFRSKWMQM